MLFDIHKRQWDPEILDYFQIPKSMLPEVLPSSGMFGMTEESAEDVFNRYVLPKLS